LRSFLSILRTNRNYRYLWTGQAVSEIGDHFNTIAVLSLSLHITGSVSASACNAGARYSSHLGGPIAGWCSTAWTAYGHDLERPAARRRRLAHVLLVYPKPLLLRASARC